jgi:uncharacterized protein YkwD
MKRYWYILLVVMMIVLQACATDAAPEEGEGALIPPDSSEISGAAGAAPSGGKPNPPSGGSCTASDANASSFASQVISLVNQQRAANGLGALTSQSQLTAAAQRHSLDMGCAFFLSHTGSDGSSPYSRIVDSGYPVNWWGENVAAGYSTAQAVMDAWMNSQVHRDNILNPNYTEIGIGYVYNANDTTLNYKHYWTMTLGSQ